MRADEITAIGMPGEIVFGASGLTEILQNVRMIICTMLFSVPLDRRFAGDGLIVDKPSPHDAARAMASLAEEVERYEPRVQVVRVEFVPLPGTEAAGGRLVPKVVFKLREGVTL